MEKCPEEYVKFFKVDSLKLSDFLMYENEYNHAVKHYQNKYGYVPLWVLTKALTIDPQEDGVDGEAELVVCANIVKGAQYGGQISIRIRHKRAD